jgi:hypothetical protein
VLAGLTLQAINTRSLGSISAARKPAAKSLIRRGTLAAAMTSPVAASIRSDLSPSRWNRRAAKFACGERFT